MRASIRLAVVLTVVLLAASACAFSSEAPEPSTPPPPSTTPARPPPPSASPTDGGTASPTTPGGTGAALPEDVRTRPTVAAAIDDTASREGVTPDQVVVAAWSPVTWTDGSLGCPQEGMSYTQALVEGELLILRVGTELFQYHARAGGPFTYCATPTAGYSVGG